MLKRFIKWLKYHLSHEWCYDQMEERGIAIFGCCNGIAGGSKATNYLSEGCCDCPYLTLTDGKRRTVDDDLISRKALLEKLSNMQPAGFTRSVAGRVALIEIENAPAVIATEATHGQWIPFTDPPKRLKAVICLYKDANGTQVGGGYVNDHGIWTLIGPAKGTITHWMHMPELPKEG